jgi:archaellum biogenesis ATPase FlaH
MNKNTKTSKLHELREKMETTDERIKNFEDVEFIYGTLIVKGHSIFIAAPPNGGKTTLLMKEIIPHLVKVQKLSVNYIDMDASQSQTKENHLWAKKIGFHYLSPLLSNSDGKEVLSFINDILENEEDISDEIFIFDTAKQFYSVMEKGSAKQYGQICRRLTLRGATIINLCHTNKYPDEEGFFTFEGVGDIKNDCDELLNLHPKFDANKNLLKATIIVQKKRAFLEPMAFEFDASREVTILEQTQLLEEIRNFNRDNSIIEAINFVLFSNQLNESEIIDKLKVKFSRRKLKRVLEEYPEIWTVTRGLHNSKIYSIKL